MMTIQQFIEKHGDWHTNSVAREAKRLLPLLHKAHLETTHGTVTSALYRLRKLHPKPAPPPPSLSPLAPVDQATDVRIVADIITARGRLAELTAQLKAYTDETSAMLDRLHAETEARRQRLAQLREVINNGDAHV